MFGGAGQPARTVVADSSQAVVEQQPTPEGTRLEITITEAQLTSLLRQQLKQQNNSYFANDTQIVIQKSGIELSGTLLKPINSYVTIGLIPTLTDGQFHIGVGTIKAGKLADIIAVNGDPLADIRVLQDKKRIVMVMKEGKTYVDRRPGKSKNVVQVEGWKKIDYL